MTIAHRLRTIIDYDRVSANNILDYKHALMSVQVMVLDEGRIAEFDKPSILLKDSNSRFYSLCKATGQSEFNVLKKMAGV